MCAEIKQNHNATRTYQEIHNVLREVEQDHFWKANTKKMQNEELKGYKKAKQCKRLMKETNRGGN